MFFSLLRLTIAQPGNSGTCSGPNPPVWCTDCNGPNPPPQCKNVAVPIDTYTWILTLSGVVLGIRSIHKKRKISINKGSTIN